MWCMQEMHYKWIPIRFPCSNYLAFRQAVWTGKTSNCKFLSIYGLCILLRLGCLCPDECTQIYSQYYHPNWQCHQSEKEQHKYLFTFYMPLYFSYKTSTYIDTILLILYKITIFLLFLRLYRVTTENTHYITVSSINL